MARCAALWLAVACSMAVLAACKPVPSRTPVKPFDPTHVEIESGLIQGLASGDVVSFRGVPYAAPPVGPLRWRPPQPAKPWTGVLNADRFGPACMQVDAIPQSEDCLTLNIWRPAAASAPLPVMVWIYGGALVHGNTAMYPADALARQGVVVVSLNYRMGRLGFFAHPALTAENRRELQGNYGYMDQQAALRWVQHNIDAFGGDPSQVTLFGESAGAGSVLVHLTSPLSRGLFERVILQSPGAPTARAEVLPLTHLNEARRRGADYARALGVAGDGAQALARLRALPAARLVEGTSAAQEIAAMNRGGHVIGVSGAILDGKLIAEPPEIALAERRHAAVPVMVGANSRELGIGEAASKDQLFALLGARRGMARVLYDPDGTETLAELKQQVLADRTLVEPARRLADLVARGSQPVWLYRFAYVAESQRPQLTGAPHGFEIPYVFNIPAAIVGAAKVTPADKAMGQLASAYWVEFAKIGDPNGPGLPEWPRHGPSTDRLMTFSSAGAAMQPDPLKARLDLWAEVWGGR
jgi:para-nitrobenzyl esterase